TCCGRRGLEGVGGGVDGVARGAGGGAGGVGRRVVAGRNRGGSGGRVACLRLRRTERGGRRLDRVGRGGGSRRRGGWRCRIGRRRRGDDAVLACGHGSRRG